MNVQRHPPSAHDIHEGLNQPGGTTLLGAYVIFSAWQNHDLAISMSGYPMVRGKKKLEYDRVTEAQISICFPPKIPANTVKLRTGWWFKIHEKMPIPKWPMWNDLLAHTLVCLLITHECSIFHTHWCQRWFLQMFHVNHLFQDDNNLIYNHMRTYTFFWGNLGSVADPHPAFGSLLASFSSSSQSTCQRSTSGSALLLSPDISQINRHTKPPKVLLVLLSNPPTKTSRKTNGHYVTMCVIENGHRNRWFSHSKWWFLSFW